MDGPARARTCFRCGRDFAGKAGRVVDGKPACPSCGNALRPEVECVACGQATKRPSRSETHGSLVCESCAKRGTHATCRRCGRHRKIVRHDDRGRPLCAACGADTPVTHACPGCGREVPGAGAARCLDCALADRVARRVEAEAEGIALEWTRELFVAFCASDDLRKVRGGMARHIGTYAAFFRALGTRFADDGEVTQARLLGLHGAEGLRRQFQAVRFLVRRLSLPWTKAVAEEVTEGARVKAALAAAESKPWAEDLAAYRASLSQGRPVATRTERLYVAAAANLLAGSGVERAARLTQAHLRRHLRRKLGQAANLARFLTWVTETSGQHFAREPKQPTRARARERAILERSAALLARLDTTTDPRQGRALLAAAISVVHGVPLLHVLALRAADGVKREDGVRLRTGEAEVALIGPLADGYRRFAARQGTYAFAGRNAVQPLSASAVDHHLQAAGLPSLRARLPRPRPVPRLRQAHAPAGPDSGARGNGLRELPEESDPRHLSRLCPALQDRTAGRE